MINDMTLKGLTLKIEEYFKVIKQEYPSKTEVLAYLQFYLTNFCTDFFYNEQLDYDHTVTMTEIFIYLLMYAKQSNTELDILMLEKFQKEINLQNEQV